MPEVPIAPPTQEAPKGVRAFTQGGSRLKVAAAWLGEKAGVSLKPAPDVKEVPGVIVIPPSAPESVFKDIPEASPAQPSIVSVSPDVAPAAPAPEPVVEVQAPMVEPSPVVEAPLAPVASETVRPVEPSIPVVDVAPPPPSSREPDVAPVVSAPTPVAEAPLASPEAPVAPVEQSYADRTYEKLKEAHPGIVIANSKLKENPVYEGSGNKMDVLNTGQKNSEGVSEERAITFKLREGLQGDKLIFMMDPKDPSRIIQMDKQLGKDPSVMDPADPKYISDAELESVVIFSKDPTDGSLRVSSAKGKDLQASAEMLKTGSMLFPIDPKTGLNLELVGYDPTGEKDFIVVQKAMTKAEAAPLPVEPGWRDKLVDIIGPIVIATGIIGGAADAAAIPDVPHDKDQATVTYVDQKPGPVIEIRQPEGPQQGEFDPSLQCPATVEKTVQEGDSLTKLIVDENGVDRYLKKGEDGKFGLDVDALYEDLMCLLVQPENMAQLQNDDPEAASLITSMLELQKVTGSKITSEQLYDAFKDKLNTPERVQGANNQLVLTYPESKWRVPSYKKPGDRGTKENPIPPSTGNAGLAADN